MLLQSFDIKCMIYQFKFPHQKLFTGVSIILKITSNKSNIINPRANKSNRILNLLLGSITNRKF
jgi:hypothetical protein